MIYGCSCSCVILNNKKLILVVEDGCKHDLKTSYYTITLELVIQYRPLH